MALTLCSQLVPVGTIKSFGNSGEQYQVGRVLREMEDGDCMVEVTLIKSGEKAEIRQTHILDDPGAV